MEKVAIVVAGGRGTRMGTSVSKQYLSIGGKPVLMHTLEVFYRTDPAIQLILVLPEADFGFWEDLCRDYQFTLKHRLVGGGASRFQSVKNGLDAISFSSGLVAIHDAVRPFVKEEVIRESFNQAAISGSAIAVLPLKDSLREIGTDGISHFR